MDAAQCAAEERTVNGILNSPLIVKLIAKGNLKRRQH